MGAIVFGTRLCGRVDQVPGLLFVGTRCLHLCYLPLVPLGTFLVLTTSERTKAIGPILETSWSGLRLPFSGRSLVTAWLRATLVVAGTALLTVGGALAAAAPSLVTLALPGAGASLFGLVALSFRWTRASYPRALELARTAGISHDRVRSLFDARSS